MRRLLIAGLFLIDGCGSSGYGDKYTLSRSRMMSPPEAFNRQDVDGPFDGPRDPDECQYLSHSYRAGQP